MAHHVTHDSGQPVKEALAFPGVRGSLGAARISRRTIAAGLAWTAPALALAPTAQAATCSVGCCQVPLGTSGWTGDITGNPSTGWKYDTGFGGAFTGFINYNDTASNQTLSHTVTGLPSTGASITFDAIWQQAQTAQGTGTPDSNTANLRVYYDGVLYAEFSSPGPGNQFQRAMITTYNGATISPDYPGRQNGWSGKTLNSFTLYLPDGVASTGQLTFVMSYSFANGTSTIGASDDWGVGNVATTQCF